jgi:putative transposase
MIMELLREAVGQGARIQKACEALGLSARTVERWKVEERLGKEEDHRRGPRKSPHNKLSRVERRRILDVVNLPRFRDLSPNQIVPLLADEGRYLGSEATVYRIMREEGLLAHRGRAKAPERRGPNSHTATGANQVWSWDISVPQQAA